MISNGFPDMSACAEALGPGHNAMSDVPGQVTLSLHTGDAVVIDYRLLAFQKTHR
jgi:hypothetical protein